MSRALITPARAEFHRARASSFDAENALIGTSWPQSRRVTAYEAECTDLSPAAARWLSASVVRMPPAQNPITAMSGEPVISRAASMADSTRLAYVSSVQPACAGV